MYILRHLFVILIYAAVLYMYDTLYAVLSKSEMLHYNILFCEKMLDEKYFLKLNTVFQTSSKRFVETPQICLLLCLSYVPFVFKALFTDFCNCACAKRLLCLSEFVILVLHLIT